MSKAIWKVTVSVVLVAAVGGYSFWLKQTGPGDRRDPEMLKAEAQQRLRLLEIEQASGATPTAAASPASANPPASASLPLPATGVDEAIVDSALAHPTVPVAVVHVAISRDESKQLLGRASEFRLVSWSVLQWIRGSGSNYMQAQLGAGDSRLRAGRAYLVAYGLGPPGKALPRRLELYALQEIPADEVAAVTAAYRRRIPAGPPPASSCAPADVACQVSEAAHTQLRRSIPRYR